MSKKPNNYYNKEHIQKPQQITPLPVPTATAMDSQKMAMV